MELLCIGEVMIELSSALSLTHALCFDKAFAGDAYNTAMAAQALGIKTGLLTRLGQDDQSNQVLQLMHAQGLYTGLIRLISGRQMGLYLASVGADNSTWQARYYRHDSAATTLHPDDLSTSKMTTWFNQGGKAVFSTGVTLAISPSARATVNKAFALARQHNTLTCLDLNYRAALWPNKAHAITHIGHAMANVEVLTAGIAEFSAVFGLTRPAHILEYCHSKGVKWLVLRLGEAGCLLGHVVGARHHFLRIPNPVTNLTIRHPIGAGDVFNAAMLAQLIRGAGLQQACTHAVAMAQQKLQQPGTVFSP
jgi:2-dehydro-3-deoxygluconokinase